MATLVMNKDPERLRTIKERFGNNVATMTLTQSAVAQKIVDADIIVCAILVPGGRTPVLITKSMLGTMRPGSVIVDVSVDQGGCAETTRPTTHREPVYTVDGVMHYCVANMPGAYPRTSTLALTSATLPWIREVANNGVERSIRESREIASALNTHQGRIANRALAAVMSQAAFEHQSGRRS